MLVFFFFKQKTAYEMRISDWSSDVCSSDLLAVTQRHDGDSLGRSHGTAMPAARMIGMAVGYQCGVDRTGGIYPAVRWRDIETLRFCPHPKACSDHQDSRWRRGAESPERDETDLSIRLAMGYRISQALWPCEAGSIPATRSSG